MMVRLASRFLWREAKSGELSLIFMALVLAVTSATAIALFSARLDLAMQQRSNDLLGADLRIESTVPIDTFWQESAENIGLRSTVTTHFPTMVLAGDEMAMAAVKAVTHGYPLRGKVTLEDPHTLQEVVQTRGPDVGEAWLEQRLLTLLNAQVGDTVEVGNHQLRISGVIIQESDRGGGFYSLSPRLMMNEANLSGSGLLGTGSRVRWRLLVAGEPKQVEQFTRLQETHPLEPNQKIQTIENSNEAVASRLQKAQRYLGLAAMLAVVLASVAVAISAKQYASRHFDISALMRTFGLSRKQVFRIYAVQLLLLAMTATSIGLGLAVLLQEALLWLLAEIVPKPLPSAPVMAWVLGASTGFVSLFGFGLPYIMPLSRVTPLRVLRKDIEPVPMAGWLLTLIALSALTLLLWLFTADLLLTLSVMFGGGLVLLFILSALVAGIYVLRRALMNKSIPLAWRFAWQHLSRDSRQSAGQIIAFSLTIMVMILIATLRTDLLEDWQANLPEDAPNVFAINIQPYELEAFNQSLLAHDIRPQKLFPTIPGRLVTLNGGAVKEMSVAEDSAINRDLILTADTELPADNKILAGQWHTADSELQVSVEEKLAERLGVTLGDTLGFNIAGQEISVTIASIREVDWGNMTPNFFMIFSQDVFETLPLSYMTSFHLAADNQAALAELIRAYSSVTFMDVQAILTQIQSLLEQVTLAIELILLFVLIAAFLVMFSSLVAGLEARLKEGAVIRALGGSTGLLRKSQLVEFVLLALVSSVFALLGAEAVRFVLYKNLLDMAWYPLGWLWVVVPLAASVLLSWAGLMLLRRTIKEAPLQHL